MRIAIIAETFLPDVNGVVTTLCRQLEYLQAHGHKAILFAPPGAPERYAGAEIVPLRGFRLPFYPELTCTPPQSGITARLRRFQPDVIHVAGVPALGATGRFVAWRCGVPLVAAYHTDWPAYNVHYGMGLLRAPAYQYLRWVHNGCTLTLCPSTATLADLRTHGFRRLKLWGRGVDTEQFHPRYRSAAWREAVGLRAGETLLLYAGRLANEKRLETLADAMNGLAGVRLVFVGDGPARLDLEQRLKGKPVTFVGYLRGEQLATAYAGADLFVFPSDTETFGQVIQEAMASGLPAVAARAGGALDLVREGVTGALFTPGAAADLQARIRSLIADPAKRQRMAQASRRIAEQRSWPHVMAELVTQYHQIQQRRLRHQARIQRRDRVVEVGVGE